MVKPKFQDSISVDQVVAAELKGNLHRDYAKMYREAAKAVDTYMQNEMFVQNIYPIEHRRQGLVVFVHSALTREGILAVHYQHYRYDGTDGGLSSASLQNANIELYSFTVPLDKIKRRLIEVISESCRKQETEPKPVELSSTTS